MTKSRKKKSELDWNLRWSAKLRIGLINDKNSDEYLSHIYHDWELTRAFHIPAIEIIMPIVQIGFCDSLYLKMLRMYPKKIEKKNPMLNNPVFLDVLNPKFVK